MAETVIAVDESPNARLVLDADVRLEVVATGFDPLRVRMEPKDAMPGLAAEIGVNHPCGGDTRVLLIDAVTDEHILHQRAQPIDRISAHHLVFSSSKR